MIEEVVSGGQHHAAIEHHQVTEGFGFPDFQFLELGLFFVQLFLYLQGKGGSLVLEYFGKPAIVQCSHVVSPDVRVEPVRIEGIVGA